MTDVLNRQAVVPVRPAVYAAVGVCTIVLPFTLRAQQPIEGTRVPEHLAECAERAPPIPHETARELAALTSNPQSDCDQLVRPPACSAEAGERLRAPAAAAMERCPEIARDEPPLPPVSTRPRDDSSLRTRLCNCTNYGESLC